MLTHHRVFQRVAQLLEEKVGVPVHPGAPVQEGVWPHLLLRQGKATREREGPQLYGYTSTLDILCCPKGDAVKEEHVEETFLILERILEVFESGTIPLEGRQLRAEAEIGGIEAEKTWVGLTIRWMDSPDVVELPKMEVLHLTEEE